MSDYDKRLFAYQMAMALARSMRSKGLISAKEYAKIVKKSRLNCKNS